MKLKLYLITIGSFRNMIIESYLSIPEILDYLKAFGWKQCTVSLIEPGTLYEIPKNPAFKG